MSGASTGGGVAGNPRGEILPAERVDDGIPWTPVLAAIGAIGVVLLALLSLAAARRRASDTDSVPASADIPASPQIASVRPARRLAEWELSALDDEPIGTVEYTGRQS